jgi:prepilin-type N-terminal cleavage/methylation domain-containing protein
MIFSTERSHTSDGGFTLIEVCVAMMLITLVATGAAQLFTATIKAADAARVQSSTAILASQKIEQFRALVWTVDVNGQPLSDRTTNLSVEPPTSGGSGLGPSPPNTLDANTPGYVDFLNARGGWVGTGATAPATARYIRRWRVQSLPEDPDNVVILQVLVTTVGRDREATAPRRRLKDDALVTTMVARRAH